MLQGVVCSDLEIAASRFHRLNPGAVVHQLIFSQGYGQFVILLYNGLSMRSEQQILVNLDEVHWLLHVFQELVCPHDLATQRGHVVAQGRVVALILVQLQHNLTVLNYNLHTDSYNLPFELYQFHLKTCSELHNTC